MSLTFPDKPLSSDQDAVYTPIYARRPVRTKKVRTWMVLAPIGAIALIGGGAVMMLNSGNDVAPLVEPAPQPAALSATSSPVQAMPADPALAQVPVAPTGGALTAEPVVAAPIARDRETIRQAVAEPVRRTAPLPAAPVAPEPEVPAGPQPYNTVTATPSVTIASPATTTSPVATAAQAPATPQVVIVPPTT